jgi:hypothetical protein
MPYEDMGIIFKSQSTQIRFFFLIHNVIAIVFILLLINKSNMEKKLFVLFIIDICIMFFMFCIPLFIIILLLIPGEYINQMFFLNGLFYYTFIYTIIKYIILLISLIRYIIRKIKKQVNNDKKIDRKYLIVRKINLICNIILLLTIFIQIGITMLLSGL